MHNIPPELEKIDTSPEWHLLDVDLGKQVFKVVRLEEIDYREAVRLAAVSGLKRQYRRNPAALRLIQNAAAGNDNPNVRAAASKVLAG